MQKTDFVENTKTIVEKLLSKEIVNHLNNGFRNPHQAYNYQELTPLLFASKSNYDNIKNDIKFSDILNSLEAEKIYEAETLSQLTSIFQPAGASNILTKASAVSFYTFHNTLLQTYKLASDILQNENISESLTNEGENGIVLFQILIESQGLETERYIKIFTALNELVLTISKIMSEEEQKSEIILLDSGSDTNVGIKSGIQTAKSLFLIFKEIWDFITNFKYYKDKQKNQALLESLTIRKEILNKIKEGVLTEEEGKQYLHMIKTRTDDLIGMKVLPKQIVIDNNQIENRKLLSEFEGSKMLSDNSQSED